MSKVRLIDANALGRYLNDCAFAEYAGVGYEREYETMCRVLKCIENAPTVDAVEVVLCKDCKWWFKDENYDGLYRCANDGLLRKEDHYCACGERTMSRYIDVDSLKRELKRNAMMALVEREETVDAVPVVRCKDCLRYYNGRNGWTCGLTGFTHKEDWYCADGERKK